ncbi:hypothetical protein GOZ97_07580 [Agrobacterium vitis]|uniref:hypothetical protein n=1 Tax=Agrobacterium vitis TaxID=373 RepID=UPI0008FB1F84|nr:hypothetical protein [Agrobacterium vitis]MUZ53060.1 hypothetical protein [Agrobacterium vitis]MUZ91279.1 hypothetical protein [Agrobacterium vitis]MVA40277.1 hypothetical protein [Agrobacterium vitis]NSX96123.1 hypothetical protein [Agrobacterium vitis]NSZ27262.1 hypothetical protein [Agrobacterium vitis]
MSFFTDKARHINAVWPVKHQNSYTSNLRVLSLKWCHLVPDLRGQLLRVSGDINAMNISNRGNCAGVQLDPITHLRTSHSLRNVIESVLTSARLNWQNMANCHATGDDKSSHFKSPTVAPVQNTAPKAGISQETQSSFDAWGLIARHQIAFMSPCAFAIGFMIACSA